MAKYDFYGVNLGTPLSLALGTSGSTWNNSILGQLGGKTKGQVFIREIQDRGRDAEYGWRVVDAVYSGEDDVMSYFRAYDEEGNFLAQAAFGVNYGSVPSRIGGGFKYRPEFGNQYYVPAQNNFMTANTGGYTVQVLDTMWPSEGLAFGMFKQGDQHANLRISFQLLKMNQEGSYPNDFGLAVR
ncbi:hypothetical protein QUF64_05985 [Anaerolineales bacterium HSG6]|nr:hypothetical protein [Anaerolineales bacterium HSG6]MDM8529521.1 hypothetical protein [Anaerolineales bacterium HSG25]